MKTSTVFFAAILTLAAGLGMGSASAITVENGQSASVSVVVCYIRYQECTDLPNDPDECYAQLVRCLNGR
jgi:hypothetical protein